MSQSATVAAVPPATNTIRSAPPTAFFRWLSLSLSSSLKKSNSNPRPRRRRLPSVRLGGRKKRGGAKSTFFVAYRALKRLKLRWLRLRYARVLKKLRALYTSVVEDFAESGAALDALQKRIMFETFYTVPMMPMSLARSVPSHVHKLNE
ncbi:Lox2p [Asimina triloba]